MLGGFDESASDGYEPDCAGRGRHSAHRSAGLAVCAKTPEYNRKPAKEIWARVRSRGAGAWGGTKSGIGVGGSREAGGKTQHSRPWSDGTRTFVETVGSCTVSFCRFPKGRGH